VRIRRGILLIALALFLSGGGAEAQQKSKAAPPEAEAHYELGRLHHEKMFEALDRAIAEYERAVALKPDYAEAHYHLGLAYHTKAKLTTDDKALYRKALREYQLYLRYSPKGELAAQANKNIKAVEARLK